MPDPHNAPLRRGRSQQPSHSHLFTTPPGPIGRSKRAWAPVHGPRSRNRTPLGHTACHHPLLLTCPPRAQRCPVPFRFHTCTTPIFVAADTRPLPCCWPRTASRVLSTQQRKSLVRPRRAPVATLGSSHIHRLRTAFTEHAQRPHLSAISTILRQFGFRASSPAGTRSVFFSNRSDSFGICSCLYLNLYTPSARHAVTSG